MSTAEFDVAYVEAQRGSGDSKEYLVRCFRDDGTAFRSSKWINHSCMNCPEKIREFKRKRSTQERDFHRLQRRARALKSTRPRKTQQPERLSPTFKRPRPRKVPKAPKAPPKASPPPRAPAGISALPLPPPWAPPAAAALGKATQEGGDVVIDTAGFYCRMKVQDGQLRLLIPPGSDAMDQYTAGALMLYIQKYARNGSLH